MNETLPFRKLDYRLQFERGWDELAVSRYGMRYQEWFAGRVQETQFALLGSERIPVWAYEYHQVAYRWQQAVEFVAKNGLNWDANPATTQGARLEKAMQKLQKHLADPEGWETPGLRFYLPKRHILDARSDTVVDIGAMPPPRLRCPRKLVIEGYLMAEGAQTITPNPNYI